MIGNKFHFKHGDATTGNQSRIYRIWVGIKQRCHNPKSPAFKWYGKRGIKVHKDWMGDYGEFKKWALRSGYADSLQIERKDNDGGYCPKNCIWTTNKVNQNNRRSCKFFQFKDGRFNISQAAKFYGLTKYQMRHRLVVMKLKPDEAAIYERN